LAGRPKKSARQAFLRSKGLRVTQAKPSTITEFINHLTDTRGSALAPATISRRLSVLSAYYEFLRNYSDGNIVNPVERVKRPKVNNEAPRAVDLDFLAKSPARRLQMPDTRTPDKTVVPPSTIMQLLEGLSDPLDRCAFAIAVFCALRTSEVSGLTWGCYQGENLAIMHTAFEGRLQPNKVKTTDSRALVPIPDLVRPYIETWRAASEDTAPDALMFPTNGKRSRKGQKVPFDSTNSMERRIYPIADKLKIPRNLCRFQVLRRTVGTDLQSHGTMKDAQTASRHQNIKTTGNIYMQPVPKSVTAALNARTRAVFGSTS
jgi:integrase